MEYPDNYDDNTLEPAYYDDLPEQLEFNWDFVPTFICNIGILASHVTLALVILVKPELRIDPLKWLVLATSLSLIFAYVLILILEIERYLDVTVVFTLCEILLVLWIVSLMIARFNLIWIAVAALCLATGRKWSKMTSVGLILGGTIFCFVYVLIHIFAIGGGFRSYGDGACALSYYHGRAAHIMWTVADDWLTPLIFIILTILLGVYLKKSTPENKEYHKAALIATALYTALILPFALWVIIWPIRGFTIVYTISKLAYIAVGLTWLLVPAEMRAAYQAVCCCCCPDKGKAEEKVELLQG